MVNKGIETAATGAGWLKGGPQMVSDVVCGIIDTWVSVIDPNDGTIRKAMSGDAATLDELASLASTIGSIVFVVYVCMTAVNLFLATAESEPAWESNCRGASPRHRVVSHWLISAQVGPRLLQELPHDSQALESHSGRRPVPRARRRPVRHGHGADPEVRLGPRQERALAASFYSLRVVRVGIACHVHASTRCPTQWKHRTILPFEGSHGSTLSGTIATITAATSACLLLSTTPDVLALARGGADKAAAEALAWTVGTALGLKYVAARVVHLAPRLAGDKNSRPRGASPISSRPVPRRRRVPQHPKLRARLDGVHFLLPTCAALTRRVTSRGHAQVRHIVNAGVNAARRLRRAPDQKRRDGHARAARGQLLLEVRVGHDVGVPLEQFPQSPSNSRTVEGHRVDADADSSPIPQ